MDFPPVKVLQLTSEIRTALLGIAAANPFVRYNSPARQQMYTNSHMAQKIVVTGLTENFLSTPVHDALAKATMGITVPEDMVVLKIFHRYPNTGIGETIAINPEVLVMYEEIKSKKVGYLSIPRFGSFHPYFGFDMVATPEGRRLAPDVTYKKGTVLFDTPGRTTSGRYQFGVMLHTAFISHMATSEDGLWVCRDALPALRFKRWERRSIGWGESSIPVNTYGTATVYKPLPDVGDYVRDDGLLCATRELDPRTAVIDTTVNGLLRVDYGYDNKLYAKGKGGKVVDIIVTVNNIQRSKAAYNQQLQKYINARTQFNTQVVAEYVRMLKKRPELMTDPNSHEMLVAMMEDIGYDGKAFSKTYKKVSLDHIRIDFVIEYLVEPNIGYKLTETHGGRKVANEDCYYSARLACKG